MLPLTKCASNLQLDNSKFLLPISHSLVTVSHLGGGNPMKYLARAHCTGMLLTPGTGNGQRATGNGQRGTGNGNLGTSVQRQPS